MSDDIFYYQTYIIIDRLKKEIKDNYKTYYRFCKENKLIHKSIYDIMENYASFTTLYLHRICKSLNVSYEWSITGNNKKEFSNDVDISILKKMIENNKHIQKNNAHLLSANIKRFDTKNISLRTLLRISDAWKISAHKLIGE